MEQWLSLKVLESPLPDSVNSPPKVYISVPKSTVKLAVMRNRVKRVLREAVRRDVFFEKDKTYRLRVNRLPKIMDLKTAQKVLEALHG